jgi:uncharacterized cofD-like protein
VKNKSGNKNKSVPGLRVVALGGGTGLSALLRGLKEHVVRGSDQEPTLKRPISDLTAIVTVTDDGGSSGRLRRENRILPPGDIRNCMVALAKDEALLSRLFQYRFQAGNGLIGHNFGNLFLAALTHVTGDFAEAVRVSSKVLAIRGRIFPSTLANVHLVATLIDGKRVKGETNISRSKIPIRKLELNPRGPRPLPKAIDAIEEADLILMGPGSLYTSVIPNLLIPEIAKAVVRSRAPRVYIANLMTQPGETNGYSVADHVKAIYAHTRRKIFDCVVMNSATIAPRTLKRYRAQGAEPVEPSYTELVRMGLKCVTGNVLHHDGVLRHDQGRLTDLLLQAFIEGGRAED